MSFRALPDEARTTESRRPATLPRRTVVIVAAGVLAAWLAAGSLGWMAPALAKVLTWAALGLALGTAWPAASDAKARWILAAAAGAAAAMTAVPLPVVNVLAVVLVLSAITAAEPGVEGRAVLTAAMAAAVLAVFRMAAESTAALWAMADALGQATGCLAGWASGRPLGVGGSFGGLDFLVLMAALWIGWLIATVPPRRARAAWAAAAILLVHAVYLLVLAFSADLAATLPAAAPPVMNDVSHMGAWSWAGFARAWLPWGLPALAAAGYTAVVVAMFGCAKWQPGKQWASPPAKRLLHFLPAALVVVAALALVLATGRPDVRGLRVLAYESGDIDSAAQGGERPAAASFALLAPLVESLGGQFTRSTTLSEKELAEADVLLLLPPGPTGLSARTDAAGGSQGLLSPDLQERILEFVRRGGALLVAAAPAGQPGAAENVFNELLAPTGIRIEDQTARSASARWEDNLQAAAPAARGGLAGPAANFALDGAASLDLAWPAMPLVVGRWGCAGKGPSRSAAYAPGQRLGDLVLAAQQRLGQGRVVVLGNSTCLSDRWLPSSYPFVGRLLGSLAPAADGFPAFWRQLLGLLALAGLVGLVAWRSDALRLAVTALVLAAAVTGCTLTGDLAAELLPEGRPQSARPLVYVDATHLGAAACDPDQDDGLGRWFEILAHHGYLPLWAPDLSPARLQRSAVLVAIAPGRPLSSTQRQTVRDFVEGGGVLLSMVGAEEAGPSLPLLADYDLRVPQMPQPPALTEPEPLPLATGGFLVQRYTNGSGEKAEAQFYAAWAAESGGQPVQRLFWSETPRNSAAVVYEPVRSGAVVLVADTYFAANKNFADETDDVRGNSYFWGWLLAQLTGRKVPSPPPPAEPIEHGMLEGVNASEAKP
jgi:hypothetical protein